LDRDRLRIKKFLSRATMWEGEKLIRDVTQGARRTLYLSDEYTL